MSTSPEYLVIPAAGLGTRMKSVDADRPKEMLPIGNKPAIQYAVEEGVAAGIANVVIVLSRKKEDIRSYFESTDLGCSFTYVYQEEATGEADAMRLAGEVVGGSASAIIYPDNIYSPAPGALSDLVRTFREQHENVAALTSFPDHATRKSGGVGLRKLNESLYRIENFRPKGTVSEGGEDYGLRTCGITVVGPGLFRYLKDVDSTAPDGEQGDEAAYSKLIREEGLLGVRLPGRIFDVGEPDGYHACLAHFAG